MKCFLFWITFFLLAIVEAAQGAESSVVQAGAARVNLTPPLEMKAALGGYGERDSKAAIGVHDAIMAKALLVSKGDLKFVIVTADILGFPPLFKAAVVERLVSEGWTANQILLLPSHSHTSIDISAIHPRNTFQNKQIGLFQKELFEHTANQLAKVIREAGKTLVPIRSGSITVQVADRNRNRRHGLTVHDTALTVTRFESRTGAPLAVLVNWTAHPTFMNEEDMLFSGDWPGHLQRTIEALIGHGVIAMYYNGAEGDQAPVSPPEGASRWERAERYGREMGILAWRASEQIKPHDTTEFRYHTETFALPKRQWHPDFMKTGGAEYGLDESKMQGFLEQLNPEQTHSTCVRIGDLEIMGVPGEMASQLGMDIKSKARQFSDAPCLTIGGLADEWVSYILPSDEYRKGGYEASMSFYGETLGPTMVQGVLKSAQNLK